MALDDDFATLDVLTDAPDAFTTGTTANLAAQTQASLIASELQAGVATASANLAILMVQDPSSLLAAAANAQYLAGGIAAQAWISQLQTMLTRP